MVELLLVLKFHEEVSFFAPCVLYAEEMRNLFNTFSLNVLQQFTCRLGGREFSLSSVICLLIPFYH